MYCASRGLAEVLRPLPCGSATCQMSSDPAFPGTWMKCSGEISGTHGFSLSIRDLCALLDTGEIDSRVFLRRVSVDAILILLLSR